MTIRFRCTAGHKLSVPDDFAGRKVRCPSCNAKILVPAESTLETSDPTSAQGAAKQPQQPNIEPPPVAAPPIAAKPAEAAPPVQAQPVEAQPAGTPPASAPPVAAVPVDSPQPKPPPAGKSQQSKAAPPAAKAAKSSTASSSAPVAEAAPAKESKPSKGKTNKAKAKTESPAPAKEPPAKDHTKEKGTKGKANKRNAPQTAAPAASSVAAQPAVAFSLPFPNAPADVVPFPEATVILPSGAIGSGIYVQSASGEQAADQGHVRMVYLLAMAVAGVSLLAAAPALPHINLMSAPVWAIIALVGLLLHVLYVAWVVSLPDWSTVWIGGCLLAATSVAYLIGSAIAAMSFSWFGVEANRGTALSWGIIIAVLFGGVAFACFRSGTSWRREFELTSHEAI